MTENSHPFQLTGLVISHNLERCGARHPAGQGLRLLARAELGCGRLLPSRPQPLSQEDLRVILGEISRLEETVQRFLGFARPQALAPQVADVRETVPAPVELIRARARQQGVKVEVDLGDEPLPVPLDRGQISTVLLNLLLNSLDAMPHGGAIRVTAARSREGQRAVVINPESLLTGRCCRSRPYGCG